MKYLAFIIGALSAATAHGTVLYKYVPESLAISIRIGETTGDRYEVSTEQPVDLSSGYLALPFTLNYALPIESTVSWFPTQSQPRGRIVEVVGVKNELKYTVHLSNTTQITTTMNTPFTDAADVTKNVTGKLIYPDSPGQLQEVRVQCPVIDYVMGGRGLTWYWLSAAISLAPANHEVEGPQTVTSGIYCKYQFRVVPEIELSFKNDNMTITGVSGDSLIQSNQVLVKGYGGDGVRARLSIANPNPNDIGVSFSATDFNQTTQTAIPTDQGTPYDFYVKVNNTDPGSREYRVNFTAQFD
ncbi:TPA: hypothetical protein KMG61_003771 [Escherichia coli]|nr:hypothetical protein [Escherichia coli]HBE6013379.1 hypothetical protein [Escherichia coli]